MKLISLKLESFRQHKDSYIQFEEGMTGIIGPNGAGKSTLVESLAFALYGSKAIRGKLDEVLTYSASAQDKTFVELVFMHDGQTYRIARSLSTAKLYLGGDSEVLVEGTTAVSDKVSTTLGMNHEEFVSTYCTEQKSLEFLSGKKGPAERGRFIIRMMGYDKLEKIQTLLRVDRRDLKNEITGLEAGLGEREDIEARIEKEKVKLEKVRKEYNEAEKVLLKAENKVKVAKKDFKAIEKVYEEYQKFSKEIETAQIKLEGLEKQIEDTEKSTSQLDTKIKKILKDSKFKNLQDLNKQLSNIEKESEDLEKQRETWQKSLEKEQEALQVEGRKKDSKLDLLQEKIKELKERLADLKKLKSKSECPTCGQTIGKEFTKLQSGFQSDLKNLETKRKQTQEELDLLQKSSQIKEQKSKLKKLEKEIVALEKDKRELRKIEKEAFLLEENNKQVKSLKKSIEKLQLNSKEQSKKREALEFSESDYNKLKATFETSRGLEEVSRLQKVRLEGDLKESTAMLKRSEKDLLAYDQKKALLSEKKTNLILFEESDTVLTEFRTYLNSSIRPRLAELASEFLAELSDGRYTTVDITEDFTPSVMEDGRIKTIISGGEEDLLNLCLRLALSSLLAERAGHSFSLLILDEVFGSLDDNRRFNVLSLLERLQNRFEQILVITHLDDIKENVRNLIFINYDEGKGEVKLGESEPGVDLAVNI